MLVSHHDWLSTILLTFYYDSLSIWLVDASFKSPTHDMQKIFLIFRCVRLFLFVNTDVTLHFTEWLNGRILSMTKPSILQCSGLPRGAGDQKGFENCPPSFSIVVLSHWEAGPAFSDDSVVQSQWRTGAWEFSAHLAGLGRAPCPPSVQWPFK